MPNLHSLKARTWRAEDDEVKDAKPNIPAGRNVGAFIRACIRALGKDPAAILSAVADHWPEKPTPKGRPRKTPEPDAAE